MLGAPLPLFNLGLGGSGISKLSTGIQLLGTWFTSGTVGVTMDLTTKVNYRITDTEGNSEVRQYDPALGGTVIYGQNARTIDGTAGLINGEQYTFDFTLNVAQFFNITTATGLFSFLQSDIGNKDKISAELIGGAWNETLPSDIVAESIEAVYTGAFTPPEGDYELTYTLRDVNNVKFDSDGTIATRWAPHVFIVGYRVDGGAWLKDVQNPAPIEGYEAIDLQYCKGYNVLTNEDGSPQYDANGEIQILDGGVIEEELAVALDKGDNTLIIGNVEDTLKSPYNKKSTWPFIIRRIPAIKWIGLTTIDFENYGIDESGNSRYDAVNAIRVDEGLSSETVVTPSNAPYLIGTPYGQKETTVSYTYPEGGSNSIIQTINYTEFAFQQLDDSAEFYMISNYPTKDTLDDVGELYLINGDI